MSKYFKIAALALLWAGPAPAQEPVAIDTGLWQLLAIDGKPSQFPANFAIDTEGKVSGQAACNRYFGENTKTLPEIALPNLGATRKLCRDMAEEDAFFATLSLVDRAEIRQNHLLLMGPEGRVLEFSRQSASDFCLSCAE